MVKGKFRCSKCSRTFSMAAHLARHTNTMHKRKGAPTRAVGRPKGKVGRPRGPGRPRGSGRPAAASDGAARIVADLRDYHSNLSSQCAAIEAEMQGIATAIDSISGAAAGSAGAPRKRGRPAKKGGSARRGRPPGRKSGKGPRAGSLPDFILRVLGQRKSALSLKDIAASVVKAGYKTKSRHLSTAVSNALPKIRGVKKVGRGMYQA